ncbi:hypothetical protein AOLI_G00259630 [Acnodon oligacanthus]
MDKLCTGALLSILILSTFIQETQTARCCLQYKKIPVRCAHLKGYTIQDTRRQCDLMAIIFQTTNGKFFCADPLMQWTQERVTCLMEKAARMKKERRHF